MKKLILIYFIIFSYTFSAYEIFDNSYILKIGTHLGGNYYETITDNLGTSHKDNTTITPFTSRTYSFELHNRTEWFESVFFGVGVSYIESSKLKTVINNGSGYMYANYMPIYLLMQKKLDSGFYPDEDMFLNVKLGIAVEYAKKEWTTATNANYTVQNILKVSSPYAAVGLGFEYNSFIIEGEYQFDLSAAQSLGGSSGWSMFSNRISVNIGYRFNGTLSGGGFGEVVTEEDPFAKYYQ